MTSGFGGNILHVNFSTVEFNYGMLFVTCMV